MKKIISALLSLLVMASSVSAFAYTDCDNESVTKLTDLKVVDGYEDGTFRPEENISLAEALKICLSAIGYHQLIEENNGEWYVPWINMALKYGLIDNDSVDPDTKISRVEASDLIYRTMNLPLCIVTGYGFSNGVPSTILDFADGNKRPFRSLLTENFQ